MVSFDLTYEAFFLCFHVHSIQEKKLKCVKVQCRSSLYLCLFKIPLRFVCISILPSVGHRYFLMMLLPFLFFLILQEKEKERERDRESAHTQTTIKR